MLGVGGVVLDRGVEPQAVALLAVVEGALEGAGGVVAPAGAATAAACALLGRGLAASRRALVTAALVFVIAFGRLRVLLGGALGGLLGQLGLLLGPARGLGLELGGDRGVVFGAEVDLLDRLAGALAIGLELVLALEGLDLLHGHFELVGDPRVDSALPDPPADLVELGAQRSTTHGGRGH